MWIKIQFIYTLTKDIFIYIFCMRIQKIGHNVFNLIMGNKYLLIYDIISNLLKSFLQWTQKTKNTPFLSNIFVIANRIQQNNFSFFTMKQWIANALDSFQLYFLTSTSWMSWTEIWIWMNALWSLVKIGLFRRKLKEKMVEITLPHNQ